LFKTHDNFSPPNNPEQSQHNRDRNISEYSILESRLMHKARSKTLLKRNLVGQPTDERKIYDDDLVEAISEEFSDRIRVVPIIGDTLRALNLLPRRRKLTFGQLLDISVTKVSSQNRVTRSDIAQITKIRSITGNSIIPFMNGGPSDQHWNTSDNGFYDWLDKKSQESIFGVELGFKADDYGLEVSNKLISRKRRNPELNISLLIDGFVSYLMSKKPEQKAQFTALENNTISMINNMRKDGINVYVNDSWNPLSSDFLAANHVKLWIFDEIAAFCGGIGIESQFREILYDEMDLIEGPLVGIITIIALLLMDNQTPQFQAVSKNNWITKESLQRIYEKNYGISRGLVNMKVCMNVPGYVQDAQHEYISLLNHQDLKEVYIMTPYFSDDRIARALVLAAERLRARLERSRSGTGTSSHYSPDIDSSGTNIDDNSKKIHVIFPKKQENLIIEEVSKYYAYYLRDNPVVETRQFYFEDKDSALKYEMLHAKQMVVVLENEKRNWTKYVKFGGSYNPAGRAHNMWEVNVRSINGSWDVSDEGPDAAAQNPIKDYLNNVLKIVVTKYSEPFPWGQANIELSGIERLFMKLSQLIWV
jgi:hypothetical protein